MLKKSKNEGEVKMLKKITAAVIAATTAIIPFSADYLNALIPMSVYAEDKAYAYSIPDWIPQSFDAALTFRNTYGATHIGDENESDLLCVVFEEPSYSTKKYSIKNTAALPAEYYHNVFVNENTDTAYEVMAYKNAATSKPDFKMQLICDSEVQKEYTFTSIGTQVFETDIYSWLPDCAEEYRMYDITHFNVSVKDNYVVFLLPHNAGTAYDWTLKDKGEDCFELAAVSDCSTISAVPLDGGEINTICAYRAVKDGCDKISYDFGAVYTGGKVEETRTANCAVFDDAQTVLLSGDMRVTLLDYDTGKLIELGENNHPMLWTNVEFHSPEGTMSTGPILDVEANPSVVDHSISGFFNADVFSFGMWEAPYDYELPGNRRDSGYYSGTITCEDQMTVTRFDNGSADVVFRLKKKENIPEKDTIRFKLIDSDNGKAINISDYDKAFVMIASMDFYNEKTDSVDNCHREVIIEPNPFSMDMSNEAAKGLKMSNIGSFNINLYEVPKGFKVNYNGIERNVYSNNSMEVIVPLKYTPTGDVNSDGDFTVSDILLLQKWLLGASNSILADWQAADFFNDDDLDIFDLILMKKALIAKSTPNYVEPDEYIEYAPYLTVNEDGLKLYLGPDESYEYIAEIPQLSRIREYGYQKNNDNWLFTEYNGQYGWIRTFKEDGITPTIYFEAVAKKPVIYLYPEEETDVHVELELTEAELSTTYPKYNNGWDVTAYPDGTLTNKADGTHHKYLFWDAVNCSTRYDFSKGFCVAGSDTESFLKEKLTYMGLTEEEMNEFIVYWLPLMEHNEYNLVAFQGNAYTDSAKLNISPAPDSMLRVFMAYVPLDNAVDIEPQQLESFERKGFTVVEWGGSEIR